MYYCQGRKRLHPVTKLMRMTGEWTWTEVSMYEHSVCKQVDYEYRPDGNVYVIFDKRIPVRTFYDCVNDLLTTDKYGWTFVDDMCGCLL